MENTRCLHRSNARSIFFITHSMNSHKHRELVHFLFSIPVARLVFTHTQIHISGRRWVGWNILFKTRGNHPKDNLFHYSSRQHLCKIMSTGQTTEHINQPLHTTISHTAHEFICAQNIEILYHCQHGINITIIFPSPISSCPIRCGCHTSKHSLRLLCYSIFNKICLSKLIHALTSSILLHLYQGASKFIASYYGQGIHIKNDTYSSGSTKC